MRRIARERMEILFGLARVRRQRGQDELARGHCRLARRISMRYNVPLTREQRRHFCRGCGDILLPGRTSTVRVRRGRLNIRCHRCGSLMRFPLSPRGGDRTGGEAPRDGTRPGGGQDEQTGARPGKGDENGDS